MIKDVQNQLEDQEKVILVGIFESTHVGRQIAEEHLDELEMLTQTAGGRCVKKVLQALDQPNRSTYIGKGKLNEVKQALGQLKADSVIFDDDLTPTQVRNLEKALNCKIVDRSGLILDIFASRARTAAAKTQVELAQLQYLMPRLTRYWTHLSRQKGGIGTKGPGETQIETDRRIIGRRISTLKEKLGKLDKQRATQRKKRSTLLRVALVGYTNAGKSTLMNALTHTNVLAENKLFATLDATTRKHRIGSMELVLSDTVGFIRKLPHNLVESFKSTLDEIAEADILLHLVDGSSPVYEDYIRVVKETLEELHCADKESVLVFNKIDRLEPSHLAALMQEYPEAIFVSAERGLGFTALEERISGFLGSRYQEAVLKLPMHAYGLASKVYSRAEVLEEKAEEEFLLLRFRIDRKDFDVIEREMGEYLISA